MTYPSNIELTIDEIKTLYNLLKHQYISYENIDAINLVRKLGRLIDESDLASRTNQSA